MRSFVVALLLAVSANASTFVVSNTSENDCLVPAVQSLRLATALQTAGADVTIKTYPLVGHFDAFWSSAECLAEIENFLTRSLRPPR